MTNKSKLFLGALLGLGLTTGLTVQASETAPKPWANIASAIAAKFNLNADDVETVVRDTFEANRTEMEARLAKHLAQAVTDGKLTQAQADIITARRSEHPGHGFGPRGPNHSQMKATQ